MSEQALTTRPQLPVSANVGAIAIEQERAIAEAQGQLILAKRFPRDLTSAHAELMQACQLQSLASVAFYSVPRGKGVVTGPTIRLAEEIARVCGNIEYGHRELSRSEGKSEVEVYAWDKQTNTRSVRQLTVMHVLDTKEGQKKLRDQKDVDDLIANKASKQLRGRILAIVPKWLVEAATDQCKKTIAGENKDEPIAVRIRRMTQAFSKFGVTTEHLEKWLGHALDKTLVDELVELTGIFNAIKDGASKPSDFFGGNDDKPVSQATQDLQAAITGAQPEQVQTQAGKVEKPAQKQAQKKVEPKPQPKPEPVIEDVDETTGPIDGQDDNIF